MIIQAAAAKANKWASLESGDTLEMIERPHGGISFVLADGQSSGRGAKAISNLVVRKTVSELAEGVRDGAAARAANDYLFTHRAGKVSATLNIVSADLVSGTLVITRNNPCPVMVLHPDGTVQALDEPADSIGLRRGVRPRITELPLVAGTTIVVFSDGLETAGARATAVFDVLAELAGLMARGCTEAQCLADALLARALELDHGRPQDDISVVVVSVLDQPTDGVRRLALNLPI